MSARRAQVRITPYATVVDAAAFVRAGFADALAAVHAAAVDGDVVVADVTVKAIARSGANVALLDAHIDDDRLWDAYVAAAFEGGRCAVVSSAVAG